MYDTLEERLGIRIAHGGERGGGGSGYNSTGGTLGAAIGGLLGRVAGPVGGVVGSLGGRAVGGYGPGAAAAAGRNMSNARAANDPTRDPSGNQARGEAAYNGMGGIGGLGWR